MPGGKDPFVEDVIGGGGLDEKKNILVSNLS
jgi:hypothetical protein